MALLGACGGGGSGDGGGTVAISSTPVAITSSNAETVAAASYDAAIGLEDANIGATSVVGAVTETDASFRLSEFALSQLQGAAALMADDASLATGVIVTNSEACLASGSFSFTLNDADNSSSLTSGDTFDLQFNSCSDGEATLSGGLGMGGIIVSGDVETPVAPYSIQATFTFDALTVTESGETATLDGATTIVISSSDGTTIDSQISGSSLLLSSGAESARLSDFIFSASDNTATDAYSISVDATVDDNTQGGRAVMTTVTPFQGNGLNDPSSGEALIVGAANSSVRLVVLDAVNVRLLVDADGDNVAETTIDTTWAQLES